MDPKKPETWRDLADHPVFKGTQFDPTWYDGDATADLMLLRTAAESVLRTIPSLVCELNVLDDSTMYVRVQNRGVTLAEIGTSDSADGQRCLFVDLGASKDEVRVNSPEEVVDYIRRARKT